MTIKFDFKTLEQPFEADWPVTVMVPQDGGIVQEQVFDVRFRTLTPAELEEVDGSDQPAENKIRKALVDVKGEDFTAELVETLIARHYIFVGLLRAHTSFVLGQPAKN